MSSTVGLSGRVAPGCQDFRSAALEMTIEFDLKARAPRGRGDRLERRPPVGVVGNDHLEDDLRSGGFADLPDRLECSEIRAFPHIGMTDEEARLQHTQCVNGGGRSFDLVMGQCNAEFRHTR